ncbi:MAG: hypothetical protein RL011_1568 [Pseudomonadota bacterium]|jgi:hypothetical protein
MTYKNFKFVVITACAISGCVPLHLQKYRQHQDQRLAPSAPVVNEAPQVTPAQAENPAQPQAVYDAAPTVYALDGQTYRLHVAEREVWDAVLSVLMRNYSPLIADKNQGIFATDWDSYFLNGVVYRNKISLRVAKGGPGVTDMVIHNSVEQLRDGPQSVSGATGPWLPSADPADEIGRIVKNMAIVLGQPAPRLQQIR